MRNENTGRFISFEGPEGSGKTTNIEFVREFLVSKGYDCLLTREPGGTELGEKIRELLLNDRYHSMSDKTELLLMFAARAQHVAEVIQPALQSGTWVLCDRFVDASFAYQGAGRGIALAQIETLSRWTLGDFIPDLTFILDVPVPIGMERAVKRGKLDRFEQQDIEFFERVRQCYLEMAKGDSARFQVIDASGNLETVQKQLHESLLEYCNAYA